MESVLTLPVEARPEEIKFLHTGKSLVCMIAANGYVFGKRLDWISKKSDIELEIFAPYTTACLVHKLNPEGTGKKTYPYKLDLVNGGKIITVSQHQRIEQILKQKEELQHKIGTLMLFRKPNLYGNYNRLRVDPLVTLPSDIYGMKIVDCSNEKMVLPSNLEYAGLTVKYNPWKARFEFFGNFDSLYPDITHNPSLYFSETNPLLCSGFVDLVKTSYATFDPSVKVKNYNAYSRIIRYASQAVGGKFDMRSANELCGPEIRIMYGEYDFFEYFDVDDAALLLEKRERSETKYDLFWTLVIAQNIFARELIRLSSNNPDLFKPILTAQGR